MIKLILFLALHRHPPAEIHCEVDPNVLTCNYPQLENQRPFTLAVPRRHPWTEYLKDLQTEASVDIEEFPGKLCLVQTHELGGFINDPVNERLDICVKPNTLIRRPIPHAESK